VHYRSKLHESLVFNPSIAINETPFKEGEALSELVHLVCLQVLDYICSVFDAYFSNAPDVIGDKFLELSIYFVDEAGILEMFTSTYDCRQQELFNFEEHAIFELSLVIDEKMLTFNFLEDVGLWKLMHD